jgi:hypothetical protein
VADLRKTLRRLIAAEQVASRLEDRFFRQLAKQATMPLKIAAVGRAVARRTLKCLKCSRRFARPLHLGRHLSTSHGHKRKAA